jgi:hypothetical protein
MDVRVDSGPQDGTVLVTWIPVTLNTTSTKEIEDDLHNHQLTLSKITGFKLSKQFLVYYQWILRMGSFFQKLKSYAKGKGLYVKRIFKYKSVLC